MPNKTMDIRLEIIESLRQEQADIIRKFPMLLKDTITVIDGKDNYEGVRVNPNEVKIMSLTDQQNAATRATKIAGMIKDLRKDTEKDYDPKKAEALHGKLVKLRKECNQLAKKKTFGFLERASALDKAVSTAKKACTQTFAQKYILPKLGRK